MPTVIFSILTAWFLIGNTISASAAADPDAVRGLIADRCTSCHEVPGYKARWKRADVNAPSFETIAKSPDVYSPDRLRAFLQKPHWPMTQFILSPRDIDNIVAFIEQLH
jgi:cytochrome c2